MVSCDAVVRGFSDTSRQEVDSDTAERFGEESDLSLVNYRSRVVVTELVVEPS